MYATEDSGKSWMKDYKFGTLVFIPDQELGIAVDELRREYDAISAQTSMAHITLTQPFSKLPSATDIIKIQDIVSDVQRYDIIIGPAVTSPNKKLLWLDITPKEEILSLREQLHETGLFRTDLPLTTGFIPHMTISKAAREPDEVNTINENLNAKMKPWIASFRSVTWIIPDKAFIFKVYQSFNLKYVIKNL